MQLNAHLMFGLLVTVIIGQQCIAEDRDQRIQLWIVRTVETTAAILVDTTRPDYDKDASAGMACLALGQIGCVNEALELFDRAGFSESSKIRQEGLLWLADGLSSGDHVEVAIDIAGTIENEFLQGSAYSLIAIRQSQRGDFEDAESLLNRIPTQAYRDRAVKQICSEYVTVGRFDDARRLSVGISDEEVLSVVKKEMDRQSKRPSVTDTGYVAFQLAAARSRPFSGASNSELEFLKHYYQAEVASELDDQTLFDRESHSARQLAESMEENDGALLLLARLMYRAGKQEESKALYASLFRKYTVESDELAFDFNKMMFGSSRNSDAEIAAACLTEEEAKKALENLLPLKSATMVAAPLFGAVVSRTNPNWAERMYEDIDDLKLRACLASNCLLSLAQ
ncbi:MAG: hypothetical protein IT422_21845 [Pirellulaceae bacterium]|nr:hypothetical protein [Pirellulaceae bacterium]